MSMHTVFKALACIAAVVVVGGCSRGDNAGASQIAYELPQKPDLHAKVIPEKYDDGTLTVSGVVKNAATLNGNPVKVRGRVVKVSVCTPDQVCDAEASVQLTDDVESSTRILTVMDPSEGLYHDLVKEFQVGALVTVEGKLSMWSLTGRTINMDGIVLLDKPADAQTAEGAAAQAAGTAPAANQ